MEPGFTTLSGGPEEPDNPGSPVFAWLECNRLNIVRFNDKIESIVGAVVACETSNGNDRLTARRLAKTGLLHLVS